MSKNLILFGMNSNKLDKLFPIAFMGFFALCLVGIGAKIAYRSEIRIPSYQKYNPNNINLKSIKIAGLTADVIQEFKNLGDPALIARGLNLSRTQDNVLYRVGRTFVLAFHKERLYFVAGELNSKSVNVIFNNLLTRDYVSVVCDPKYNHLFKAQGFVPKVRLRFAANRDVDPQDYEKCDIRQLNKEEFGAIIQKRLGKYFFGSDEEPLKQKVAYGLFVDGNLASEIILIGGGPKEAKILGGNFAAIYIETQEKFKGNRYAEKLTKYVINECNKKNIILEWACDSANKQSRRVAEVRLGLKPIGTVNILERVLSID